MSIKLDISTVCSTGQTFEERTTILLATLHKVQIKIYQELDKNISQKKVIYQELHKNKI